MLEYVIKLGLVADSNNICEKNNLIVGEDFKNAVEYEVYS